MKSRCNDFLDRYWPDSHPYGWRFEQLIKGSSHPETRGCGFEVKRVNPKEKAMRENDLTLNVVLWCLYPPQSFGEFEIDFPTEDRSASCLQ